MSVYDSCPVFANDRFRLEFSDFKHCGDLLKVYSDKKSVPLFNSDNCGGDNFYYTTYERMKEAIGYWQWEYSRKSFVRLSIIDISSGEAIGTVEMFKRIADDYFNNTVLLRLDLRSDYENKSEIIDIITIVIDSYFDIFSCNSISTKAIPCAVERIAALRELNFIKSDEYLLGHDGTKYSDYYIYFN